jgi:hypothetical protein
MQKKEVPSGKPDKKLAAVCGLFCEACSWFIATHEDADRLQRLAAQSDFSEEEARCYGCRSDKRIPYCATCKMYSCAEERGIDFCSQCQEYPCDDLQKFQTAMPHRLELWDNLEQIKSGGYEKWMRKTRQKYTCPQCQTINSAYDLKCRSCGHDPSCSYVARYQQEIEKFKQNQ